MIQKRRRSSAGIGSLSSSFRLDQRQTLVHCIDLFLHIPNDGRANDIALTIHNVGGGLAENLRDEVLLELALWIWGDVHIGDSFFC